VSSDGLSYAALHRLAVREARRVELNLALNEIERTTHAVVDKRDAARVYWYGDLAACEDFARGLWEVVVVPMTIEIKNLLSDHKVRAYRR